mmetsp:Transcript_14853/g.25148  ORF Transcript_14853/g.25148 Transcript_14853/m.25148 type:complete len:343 (+) Transcript_14853:138-1166(+)
MLRSLCGVSPTLQHEKPTCARFRLRAHSKKIFAQAANKGNGSGNEKAVRFSNRPKRIILVRHGESEGNVDEAVYQRTPDHRVRLTQKGCEEAQKAGAQIRFLTGEHGRVYFYVSPYVRTLQTLLELSKCFSKEQIAGVREEPRIREQEFGNLQDERMPLSKRKRMTYGRFFFRFPDGESAADVYDRVTGFRETLRGDIDGIRFQNEDADNLTIVIVIHGISLRVFLMRWYKLSLQQFEQLHNPKNCELVVMERGKNDRYSLSLHHSEAWLREFGFDDQMIEDQKWQAESCQFQINTAWPTSGPSFFDDLQDRIDQNSGPDNTPTPTLREDMEKYCPQQEPDY